MPDKDPLNISGQVVAEKYRSEHLAGEGGFAVVYVAEHRFDFHGRDPGRGLRRWIESDGGRCQGRRVCEPGRRTDGRRRRTRRRDEQLRKRWFHRWLGRGGRGVGRRVLAGRRRQDRPASRNSRRGARYAHRHRRLYQHHPRRRLRRRRRSVPTRVHAVCALGVHGRTMGSEQALSVDVSVVAIEARRLEAREPAGVRLGGSGDATRNDATGGRRVRPAMCSRSAWRANASSLPAATSPSSCLSQASASCSTNHFLNRARLPPTAPVKDQLPAWSDGRTLCPCPSQWRS